MSGVGGFPVSAYWNLLGTYKIEEKSMWSYNKKRLHIQQYDFLCFPAYCKLHIPYGDQRKAHLTLIFAQNKT